MTPKETAQALADYLRGAIINVTAPGPLQREMLDAIKRISSLAAQQHPEPAAPAVRALSFHELDAAAREARMAFCLDKFQSYDGAFAFYLQRTCASAWGLQLQGREE